MISILRKIGRLNCRRNHMEHWLLVEHGSRKCSKCGRHYHKTVARSSVGRRRLPQDRADA